MSLSGHSRRPRARVRRLNSKSGTISVVPSQLVQAVGIQPTLLVGTSHSEVSAFEIGVVPQVGGASL
jgi:hypothetical protein